MAGGNRALGQHAACNSWDLSGKPGAGPRQSSVGAAPRQFPTPLALRLAAGTGKNPLVDKDRWNEERYL